MLYLLRGRLIFSESGWWRILASLLPVLPLLHVYAAHETQLGIYKEPSIFLYSIPFLLECFILLKTILLRYN